MITWNFMVFQVFFPGFSAVKNSLFDFFFSRLIFDSKYMCCTPYCLDDTTIKPIIEWGYPVGAQWIFFQIQNMAYLSSYLRYRKETFQRSTPLEKLFWKRSKKSVYLKVLDLLINDVSKNDVIIWHLGSFYKSIWLAWCFIFSGQVW